MGNVTIDFSVSGRYLQFQCADCHEMMHKYQWAYKGWPNVFQGHPPMFKLPWTTISPIWARCVGFRTLPAVSVHILPWIIAHIYNGHIRVSLLFFKAICPISISHGQNFGLHKNHWVWELICPTNISVWSIFAKQTPIYKYFALFIENSEAWDKWLTFCRHRLMHFCD